MQAIIVAGPNGSGKTTFSNEYVSLNENVVYLGADLLAEKISPTDVAKARVAAGRLFHQEIQSNIEQKTDLVIETTLSGVGSARIINNLKSAGYLITIHYLLLDSPEACITRVQTRVKKGGHDVPAEDIIRRYYRSKLNFWNKVRFIVDRWQLFYNSDNSYEEVAVGNKDDYVVSNMDLFNSFTDKLGEAKCPK